MGDGLQEQVAGEGWYHTIELPGGVVTPGFYDHRKVLARYELRDRYDGLRVLDVGTFDGYFAFELERRGASVVGLDIDDEGRLDWPAPLRRSSKIGTEPRGRHFALAREALGSNVERVALNVYDVTPEKVGRFDIVFVGSMLIHLRDPVGALMALHEVCDAEIQVVEEVHRGLDLLSRRAPYAKFNASSPHMTWWIPNRAGWAHMLAAAGFVRVRHGPTFVIPFRERRGGVRSAVLWASPR